MQVRRYPWFERYTADQHVKLMHTYSDHVKLAPDVLRHLCAGVHEVIERFGGAVERPYVAMLYVARLKETEVPGASRKATEQLCIQTDSKKR